MDHASKVELLAVSPLLHSPRACCFALIYLWCGTACGKRKSRLRRKPGTARSTTFDICCWQEGTSCSRPLMYIPRSSHCAHPRLSAVLSLFSLSLQLSDQAEQEEEEDSIAQREMTWPYSFSDKRPNISLGTLRSSFAYAGASAPVSQPFLSLPLSYAEVESRPVAPPNKWSPEATLRPHKGTGDQSASSYDHGRVNELD